MNTCAKIEEQIKVSVIGYAEEHVLNESHEAETSGDTKRDTNLEVDCVSHDELELSIEKTNDGDDNYGHINKETSEQCLNIDCDARDEPQVRQENKSCNISKRKAMCSIEDDHDDPIVDEAQTAKENENYDVCKGTTSYKTDTEDDNEDAIINEASSDKNNDHNTNDDIEDPFDSWIWKYNQLKERLSYMASITSIQGCINIRNSQTMFGRIIWFSIALALGFTTVIKVSNIVVQYLSYPSADALYSREEDVTFPSITICGARPIVFSENFHRSCMNSNCMPKTMDVQDGRLNQGILLLMNESGYESQTETLDFLRKRLLSPERYVENVDDFPYSRLRYLKKNDLILACTFQGKECPDALKFKEVKFGRYGNCVTIDSNNTMKESGPDSGLSLILFSNSYSPLDEFQKAMNLFIYLVSGVSEFDSTHATSSDGIRLAIHAPGTIAEPEHDGIDLSPGTFNTIGLTQDVRTLLEPPYGDCTKKIFNEKTTYKYTKDLCLDKCMQEEMVAKCGCMTPKAQASLGKNGYDVSYCGRYYNTIKPKGYPQYLKKPNWRRRLRSQLLQFLRRLKCESDVLRLYSRDSSNMCTSKCKTECTKIVYDPLTHATPWPNEKYYKQLNQRPFITFMKSKDNVAKLLEYWFDVRRSVLDSYCELLHGDLRKNLLKRRVTGHVFKPLFADVNFPFVTCSENITAHINRYNIINKVIEKNFLKVNIFFRSLNVNRIAAEPNYPLNKFLSEFGGIIGMYLGMSAVSLVELGYIMVAMVFILLFKYKR
ncbi:unnamed protein product [Owenia fusiformis]|uniref:Uncharacterized protein n=1 Tax=Owenia fusiformis TaxID=6347 RepID=A0A8J1UK82_OWEFU|nr:unnamed protein product [Owenia fusiformis]